MSGAPGRAEASEDVSAARWGPRLSSAARARRPAAAGRVERLAAGARLGRVRVLDGEATTHQCVDVVDLGTIKILETELVDAYRQALNGERLVVVSPLVVERH